ncbi:hypothetical protein H5T87_09185 [bacterium]|nr:hypothetical protein [bacterium]
MLTINEGYLKSPSKFKENFKSLIRDFKSRIKESFSITFEEEEIGDLILSALRCNDFEVIKQEGKRKYVNKENLWCWVTNKLLPNTYFLCLSDEDVLRLLIFSIEITYRMFTGETRATVTAKGFREKRRTFEEIVIDQFVGKFGEIVVKKFIEGNFPEVRLELDWDISRDIEKHKNDIVNANKLVSIKTSPALAGVWAEADENYDYGIMVKCSVPQPLLLQFFIEVCGFSRLIEFVEAGIPSVDGVFKNYIEEMRKRISSYKCGEIRTYLKGFLCGYFKTSKDLLVKEGDKLQYLGSVREKRYLIKINELRWKKEDWKEFLEDIGLGPIRR